MLIDAFEPMGVTRLAVDSIFMMPHLGVLSTVHPEAATEVFEKDCLIRLGTCIAPVGRRRRSDELATIEVGGKRETLKVGQLKLLPIGQGETLPMTVTPVKGVDVGGGPGVPVRREVRGGVCGLVFDGRGRRPIPLPEAASERVAASNRWSAELALYPAAPA